MSKEYKPIKGYEDRYAINIYGKVISLSDVNNSYKGLVRKHKYNRGYHQIILYRNGKQKSYYVHRLVYETFKGEIPEGLQINHIDGNKSNNHLSNLELVTPQENMLHSVNVLGTHRGENSSNNKLTNDDIPKIRELAKVKSLMSIARLYDVHHSTISRITNGKAWTHIK